MDLHGKRTALLVAILATTLLISVPVHAQQSPYAPNVTANESSTVNVSGGTATVDDTSTTGVSVSITGATGVASATVTTESLNGPSSGVSTFSTNGAYFDVNVALPSGESAPAGATVTVCFTDPTATSSDTLEYWSGGSWNQASNVSVSGTKVCGSVPLSALTGTNFVIAPAPVDYTIYYIAAIVAVVIVIALVALMVTRRKKT